tara:strand:- start:2378 stop:2704 length:327 start_codon:yes stop_codon:yes gene_type:complete
MNSYSLTNNRYVDFVQTYEEEMLTLCKSNTNSEYVVLFDLDKYDANKIFSECAFLCDVNKLPDYAKAKVSENEGRNCHTFAVKHCNLCLVSDLNEDKKWTPLPVTERD